MKSDDNDSIERLNRVRVSGRRAGSNASHNSIGTDVSASIRGLIAAYTPGPKTETTSENRRSWVLSVRSFQWTDGNALACRQNSQPGMAKSRANPKGCEQDASNNISRGLGSRVGRFTNCVELAQQSRAVKPLAVNGQQ